MKLLFSSLLASTVLLSVCAFKPANTENKAKKPITYMLDDKASSAVWTGRKLTGEHTGTIKITKGEVTANGKEISKGNFELDMNSITCTDIADKKDNEKLINHLRSDDFFSIEKHPASTFEITKASFKEGNAYDITGKLTIKGITHEITFPAMIKIDDKTLVAIAKFNVNRTKYDVKYASATFFSSIGDKAIKDDFEMNINFVAKAK